jgi:hypothetical protein
MAAALVVALVSTASAQSEEDKAKARAGMAEGAKLLDRKQYEPALRQFEESYRLVASAKILFNIGVAKRGLGRKAEALEAFEAFLEQSPFAPAPSRAQAEKARDQLRQQVGFVQIDVDVAGASVSVDGRPVGTSPIGKLVPVDLGPRQITAEKAGVARHQTVTIPVGGQKATATFELDQAAAQTATATTTTTTGPAPAPAPSPARAPAPAAAASGSPGAPGTTLPGEVKGATTGVAAGRELPAPAPGPSGLRAAAPWIAGGAALLAAGLGVAALMARNEKAREHNRCGEAMPTNADACKSLRDDAESLQRWEMGAFVTAGALTAISVTLFLLNASARQSADAAQSGMALGCGPLVDWRGMTCAVRF